ncbi:MAG: methyl-accepting chemotaxis protein [Bdellovibrionota bacterium]
MFTITSHTRMLLILSVISAILNIFFVLDLNWNDSFNLSYKSELIDIAQNIETLPNRIEKINTVDLKPIGDRLTNLKENSHIINPVFISIQIILNTFLVLLILASIFDLSTRKKKLFVLESSEKIKRKANNRNNYYEKIAIQQAISSLNEAHQGIKRSYEESEKLKETTKENQIEKEQLIKPAINFMLAIKMETSIIKSEMSDLVSRMESIISRVEVAESSCHKNATAASTNKIHWSNLLNLTRICRGRENKIKTLSHRLSTSLKSCYKTIEQIKSIESSVKNNCDNLSSYLQSFTDELRNSREKVNDIDIEIESCKNSVTKSTKLVNLLSDRAEEIVNTIDVIDDIAEQTNLLALNASIEAARAGEQGQGFAVVAEEVRKLAGRSSTATKSITNLLTTIQLEADQASASLHLGVNSVSSASKLIKKFSISYNKIFQNTRKLKSEIDKINEELKPLADMTISIEGENKEAIKYSKEIGYQANESINYHTDLVNQASTITTDSDRLSRSLVRQLESIDYSNRQLKASSEMLKNISNHASTIEIKSTEANLFLKSKTISPQSILKTEPSSNALKYKYLNMMREAADTLAQIKLEDKINRNSNKNYRIKKENISEESNVDMENPEIKIEFIDEEIEIKQEAS